MHSPCPQRPVSPQEFEAVSTRAWLRQRDRISYPSEPVSWGCFLRGLRNIFIGNVRTGAAVLAAAALVCGCANQSATQTEPNPDPLEAINRPIFKFNEGFDRFLLRPIATGYKKITPSPVRTGIANFYDNFSYPVVIFNDFLQAKFVQGFAGIGRFIVNSTVGVLGFLDPATDAGLPANREDFGQTMARWGIPSGPYFVVPFLGANTIRDGAGQIIDVFYLNPVWNIDNHNARAWIFSIGVVQARASLLVVSEQIDEAFDPYLFVREAYLQNREYLIYDGYPPEDDEYFEDFEDEDF